MNSKLHQLLNSRDDIIILGEDIQDPYGGAFKVTKGLSQKHPQKIFSTPISEGAIIGVANGLALRGFHPIVEIMFGDFLTLTADQIINHLCKYKWMYNNRVDPSVVIRTPMGGRRGYGPTHSQTLEKIFLGVPFLDIVAPSNFHDPGQLIENCIDNGGPFLFIENKSLYPNPIYIEPSDYIRNFKVEISGEKKFPIIHLSNNDFEEVDFLIFCYGGIVPIVENASDGLLRDEEITSELFIPSLINHFNDWRISEKLLRCKNILIVEESSTPFGWGAEIVSWLIENHKISRNKTINRIGSLHCPIPSSKNLENIVLPSADFIIQTIKDLV